MFTKFNDMYSIISDVIQSYIKDGYKIDVKESVIDHEEDKDCIFKSVLKIDVDGIECKTIISFNENEDDKTKYCVYHKIEIVGDTKWSEETYTYNYTTDKYKLNNNVKDNSISKTDNDWLADHLKRRKCIKLISDKHGFRWVVNKDISEKK